MNLVADTLMAVVVKLLILIGFIAGVKYWRSQTNSTVPMIVYWIFGLGFVLLMGFTVFQWCFTLLPFPEDSLLGSERVGSLSAIFGIALYIVIGTKYLKKA